MVFRDSSFGDTARPRWPGTLSSQPVAIGGAEKAQRKESNNDIQDRKRHDKQDFFIYSSYTERDSKFENLAGQKDTGPGHSGRSGPSRQGHYDQDARTKTQGRAWESPFVVVLASWSQCPCREGPDRPECPGPVSFCPAKSSHEPLFFYPVYPNILLFLSFYPGYHAYHVMNEEQKSLLILSHTPQLGAVRIRKLVEFFGSAQAVLKADTSSLQEVPGLGFKTAQQIVSWEQNRTWQEDLKLVERYRVQLLTETDPFYPTGLRDLKDAPVLLYALGTLTPDDQRSVAVVGTRQASHYGKEMAEQFAADLASYGVTVVSGLARGIDTAAHDAALKKGGRTIAVIGSGLANLYPKENAPLARRITESGAVLSEYAMATAPDRTLFPRRNRIVSGMSDATLLIEAPVKSGAMLTAELARSQGKHLFVVPGRLDSETFNGNHQLLREGKGRFAGSAHDLCLSLGWSPAAEQPLKKEQKAQLSSEEQLFLKELPQEEFDLETVLVRTKLAPSRANVLLIGLVLKKQIKEYPGKIYKKSGKN